MPRDGADGQVATNEVPVADAVVPTRPDADADGADGQHMDKAADGQHTDMNAEAQHTEKDADAASAKRRPPSPSSSPPRSRRDDAPRQHDRGLFSVVNMTAGDFILHHSGDLFALFSMLDIDTCFAAHVKRFGGHAEADGLDEQHFLTIQFASGNESADFLVRRLAIRNGSRASHAVSLQVQGGSNPAALYSVTARWEFHSSPEHAWLLNQLKTCMNDLKAELKKPHVVNAKEHGMEKYVVTKKMEQVRSRWGECLATYAKFIDAKRDARLKRDARKKKKVDNKAKKKKRSPASSTVQLCVLPTSAINVVRDFINGAHDVLYVACS